MPTLVDFLLLILTLATQLASDTASWLRLLDLIHRVDLASMNVWNVQLSRLCYLRFRWLSVNARYVLTELAYQY